MAQDDYYYEIQLTNKQLVFYFLAGATGLILSFLAGVMVGKGVDASPVEARSRLEGERIVPEAPAALEAEDMSYAQTLDDKQPAPAIGAPAAKPSPASTPRPKPSPTPRATATPAPKPKPTPRSTPAPATPAPAGAVTGQFFTIQVGAFKDQSSADKVMGQLKAKGYAAYVVTPEGADGLYNVRVGRYAARADADRISAQLRDKEKFKPFIVTQ